MIKLDPYKICPFGSFCEHRYQIDLHLCRGLDPNRSAVFICELWAENYQKEVQKEDR